MDLRIEEGSLSKYQEVSRASRTRANETYMSVTMSEEDFEQLDDFFDRENLFLEQGRRHSLFNYDTTKREDCQ